VSKDITPVLSGWEYDPNETQVRIVAGADGREKLQMRIDLGLIQMELDGRPDGTRPEAYDSLLDAREADAKAALAAGKEFTVDPRTCAELMREGVQYYHRYLAAFHLQRYDLVARDTARNLRLFAFVVKHAARPIDKVQFDRYRPYVTMMQSRALAHQCLDRGDHAAALAAIDEGIAGVRAFLRDYEQPQDESQCAELGFLLRWRREVEKERPVGPVERLEQQLALAIALEDYEEAARVRDQLNRLKVSGIARVSLDRPGGRG
jgi:UvrB/uvrC motif